MKILLSDITEEGLELAFEEALSLEPLKLRSPARVTLRIDKIGPEVFARGNVRTSMELQCGRCLRSFEKDVDLNVNVVYHPVEELKGEERHEIRDDELEMGFYQGDELDVRDLVTEQLLLNVPMKPLCSDSCKGICPDCGTDLNIGTCACERKGTDPRLEILRKLLGNGKE
jgi:uncharacterized protein